MSSTFDQPELNRKRLESLKKISPALFESSIIEWNFTGQTAAQTDTEAKKLFHGFEITFLPTPGKESSKSEISYLSSVISSDSLGKDTLVPERKIRIKKKNSFSGFYYPRSAKKRSAGIVYNRKGIRGREPKYTFTIDTIVRFDSTRIFIPSESARRYIASMPDSVIFKVLERKQNWKNILFVCDVTGSMSPYSAELLVWNRLNFHAGRGKYFTFFNDGDNQPDSRKIIGRTGGIYHVEASTIEDVEKKIFYTISKGSGGDCLENNIEALLAAIDRFPSSSEIVLVADNFATIKVLQLHRKINKPVHIILCGVIHGLVNADYVQLAYATKGSIHTMQEDIENLALINEGQTIRIGNSYFNLSKGRLYFCRRCNNVFLAEVLPNQLVKEFVHQSRCFIISNIF